MINPTVNVTQIGGNMDEPKVHHMEGLGLMALLYKKIVLA